MLVVWQLLKLGTDNHKNKTQNPRAHFGNRPLPAQAANYCDDEFTANDLLYAIITTPKYAAWRIVLGHLGFIMQRSRC
jgi:hypothetical protein